MLKKVLINGKKVPIPVPVRTLEEALRWVDETLVPAGHSITRVALDDRPLADVDGELGKQRLGEHTKLEVRIDSPIDLAVQTLEAMRNLATAIGAGLKPLAVDLWQARIAQRYPELEAIESDVQLMLDLSDHAMGLVDPMHLDAAAIQGLAGLLRRAAVGLSMARSNSDWKGAARILLNRLEPILKDMVNETETLQIRVLSQQGGSQPAPMAKAPTG